MSVDTLTAKVRYSKGKKATRLLRQANRIPAVLYGAEQSVMLDMHESTTRRFIAGLQGSNQLIPLQITDDKGESTENSVLIQEIQKHPFRQELVHLDFRRLDAKKPISLKVPLHLVGEDTSPGVKKGGVAQLILREVPVTCLPSNIPEYVVVDVSELDFHETIRIEDIQFPESVTCDAEQELSVATIIGRTKEEIAADDAAEAAESGAEDDAAEAEDDAENK
ncbi:MAG: 50S ribosomal protein L25 [SAR324 cluster bacterium]|nr:50S ribosomal protein L25 [SAR324 cluster bacterium]